MNKKNFKDIKCIIFDFDNTMYYDVDWSAWDKVAQDWFEKHCSYLGEEGRMQLLTKYKIKKRNGVYVLMDDLLCKMLCEIEGSPKAWLDYRDNLPLQDTFKKAKVVANRELEKCARIAKLYIVSNSRQISIKQIAKHHKIDLSFFEQIITNDFDANDMSKAKYYKQIMERENLTPKQILVVGDSKSHDIEPAEKLGMRAYQCQGGFTYEELFG